MLSKNKIKFIKSLQQKKNRSEFNAFIVEGRKSVSSLRNSGFKIIEMGAFSSKIPIVKRIASFLEEKPDNVTVYVTHFTGEPTKIVSGITTGVVVMGSESHGVSNLWESIDHTKITISSAPNSKAESLNVAVATSIVCFQIKQG